MIVIKFTDGDAIIPVYIDEYIRSGPLNSALFLSSLYYFMTIGIQLFISKPFKLPYYKNKWLTLWTILCLGLAIIFIFFNNLGKWLNVLNLGDTLYIIILSRFTGFNILMLAILIATNICSWITLKIFEKKLPTIYKLQ